MSIDSSNAQQLFVVAGKKVVVTGGSRAGA